MAEWTWLLLSEGKWLYFHGCVAKVMLTLLGNNNAVVLLCCVVLFAIVMMVVVMSWLRSCVCGDESVV